MWNWITALCLLGLCFSSVLWADCGVQSLIQAPAFTPIKSSLDDISYSDLLGKTGERVTVRDDLPAITVTNKAFVPPHWAESIDWDAYQQIGKGPAFLTVYLDNHHRVCRLEKRNFTPAFFEERPDLRSRRRLQETLDLRKAARMAKDSDMRLEELVWFDYAPSGQLLSAQRYIPNEDNHLTLNVRRCFYYSERGDLLGSDEREDRCPEQAPAELSPRYVHSDTGQLLREISQQFSAGVAAEDARLNSDVGVSVYDETGEIARYLSDENHSIYRMPKSDWIKKDRYERTPSNVVVSENWRIKLFDLNLPLKYSPWVIQEKLILDDAGEWAPTEWKGALLKGKTDGNGMLTLNSAQQLQLWEAVKRAPGKYFLRFDHGLHAEARLYPQVEEAVWMECLKLDDSGRNPCR